MVLTMGDHRCRRNTDIDERKTTGSTQGEEMQTGIMDYSYIDARRTVSGVDKGPITVRHAIAVHDALRSFRC